MVGSIPARNPDFFTIIKLSEGIGQYILGQGYFQQSLNLIIGVWVSAPSPLPSSLRSYPLIASLLRESTEITRFHGNIRTSEHHLPAFEPHKGSSISLLVTDFRSYFALLSIPGKICSDLASIKSV